MLHISFIRDHADEVQTVADAKGIPISIAQLLAIDEERRQSLREVEALRSDRNRLSKMFAPGASRPDTYTDTFVKTQIREINHRLRVAEEAYEKVKQRFDEMMLLVPNVVSPDTPQGLSDADNVEIRRVGEPPDFSFSPLNHVDLMERHQMADIRRGVKVSGTRGYFLTGVGAELHRAVQQLALVLLVRRGFTPMEVPLMVREEAMFRTGFFPLGRDQTYHIEDDKWLVGTSEVPLISLYSDEIIDASSPIRLACASTCFRNEVGSAGRDTKGLYRVHQFAKVEQVVICSNDLDESTQILEEITRNAEELLSLLELPYRVVQVCTGNLSQKNYKQYDIETWMPSRQAYGETHSASLLLDFQARRANIRFKDSEGKLQYCHTLNNTAVASPRILIPLIENHQQQDGRIHLPKALRPYLNGRTIIS